MKIENLFNTIDQYLAYLDNATDPNAIAGLIQSIDVLFGFLFMFLFQLT